MDTPDLNATEDIARVAADDVRHLFERPGIQDIVRLANDVAQQSARPAQPMGDRRVS